MAEVSRVIDLARSASPIAARYRVEGVLGAGAHAVVMAAHDAAARRQVALKIATRAGRGPLANETHALDRLTRSEARVGPALHAVHDVAHLGAVVVTERIGGVALSDGPPAARRRASAPIGEVARGLLEALARTHEAGVVHGDLKPEHVFLTRDGVRLIDFGLARRARCPLHAVDEPSLEFAAEASLGAIGSPAYLAPERFLGWPADEASDLYAVGAILFELLAGRALVGDEDDLAAARHIHLHEEPRWPANLRRGGRLVDLTTRCLEKDPWRRPRDARDALSLLGAAKALRRRRRRAGSR